tara:strand:- start:2898 stop:3914 length:1017 start_codon:yes stop_codon:yes gene_type:complete
MKILYGIQGTGNGHIIKSSIIIKELKKRGHEIETIISNRTKDNLLGMNISEPFQCLKSLTFSVNKGAINYISSIKNLTFKDFLNNVKKIDTSKYDLVISDFEPITAWAAKIQKKKAIGISHQNALLYKGVPKKKRDIIAQMVLRWYCPTDIPIGIHWSHFNQPILPPIIDEFPNDSVEEKNLILVYLNFEDPNQIVNVLKNFKDYLFKVYCSDFPTTFSSNIRCCKIDRKKFTNDLLKASGVICNSGFELPSECFSLNKRVLVKPISNQMEQESNALAIEELNIGHTTAKLNTKVIGNWLQSDLRGYVPYKPVSETFAEWIESGDFNDLKSLCDASWS